ncbi:ankyrin repeat domain-containing protein [Vermiphilus pyriformis]|nr:MAG: ankyrin repeat domain-containing protein [Vermiphilus pyriformis]
MPLIAAIDAKCNDNTVRFLISMGADINQRCSPVGDTALIKAVKLSDKKMVDLLIKLNADVNVGDNNDCTPLMYAAQEGKIDIAQLLIDAKVDLKMRNTIGDTPLLLALARKHLEMVKMLINAGADVNVSGKDGITPISYAIRYNLEEIKCVMKEKILEKIENTTNVEDRIALEDQLKQLY